MILLSILHTVLISFMDYYNLVNYFFLTNKIYLIYFIELYKMKVKENKNK